MPHKNYVDGDWRNPSEKTFSSQNPATGETIGEFYEANSSLVDESVEAASEAFEDWRELSYIDRAEYMWDVYNKLREQTDELGEVVTRECGKEISEGRADIVEAAHMVEWAAGNARHPHGDVVPSEIPEKDSYMRRKPRGVTACITPWNFPIAIPFWHMAVALVEGNTIVWKPAEQTPKCGKIIADIMDDVGVPDGVFNLVQGYGEPVGSSMVQHDDVDIILFTGSADVGETLQEQVAEDYSKQIACEMGGKNSLLITEEADVELAVKCAILSSFKTTGQRCVSTERLLIHSDVYEEFKKKFVSVAENIQVGDPLDEDTFMGPMVNEEQVQKFRKYNQIALDEGANVLVDRAKLDEEEIPDGHEDGFWVGPFAYEINYDEHRCLQEEVFGPHVALVEYQGDIERGVNMHNDTDYGLTGAIISEDRRQINYFRDYAEVGLGYANIPCIGAEVQLPFGGVKKSGNGYPSAREIIEVVTERTAWTVNNGEGVELAQDLSSEITTDEGNNT
jgi:aldehyde dehydrogenase (NAD+)